MFTRFLGRERKMVSVRQPVILSSRLTRILNTYTTSGIQSCSCFTKSSASLLTLQRLKTKPLNYNIILPSCSLVNRYYAKGRNKTKSSKSGPKHADVPEDDIAEILDILKYREELDQVLEGLKLDYLQNMSIRTSFASFDRLLIQTDDGSVPLNQIASVTQKTPSVVMIDMPRTRQYVPNVLEALQKSAMNLNPQQEKTHTIFVNIPKVSREHREKMAKGAKTKFNEAKDKMSKVYNRYMKTVTTYINNKGDRNLAENVKVKLLQEMREGVEKADTMMKAKQKEILS